MKLLDFGLAKRVQPVEIDGPTQALGSVGSTEKGMILGTMGYMSPEQVRGETVDGRSDIFSFGSLLFELLTGQRAFARNSAADTLAAILREDPPEPESSGRQLPLALRRILAHCLEKDPGRRFQDAQDLAFALETAAGDSGNSISPAPAVEGIKARGLRNVGFVAALVLVAASAAWLGRRSAGNRPASAPLRFALRPPEGMQFPWARAQNAFAVSPDGLHITFVARGAEGRDTLWVRTLANNLPAELPGTEGTSGPFWSPDGRSIAFFAHGKLKKLDIAGGPPVTLCEAPMIFPSGTWGSQHSILFSGATDTGVNLVPESGGTPRVVLKGDVSRRERGLAWPSFLPDGRHFLYLGRSESEHQTYVRLADLTDGRTIPILSNCSRAQFVPGSPDGTGQSGHILFVRDGNLMAQAFDCGRLKLLGEPAPTGHNVWQHAFIGAGRFSASDNGVLATRGNDGLSRLAWFDRTGRQTGILGSPAGYDSLRLSADSKKVAVISRDPRTGLKDLLLGDVAREVLTRLELGGGDHQNAAWSPEGTRLALSVGAVYHPPTLHLLNLGSPGALEPIGAPGGLQRPNDWTPDGRNLLYFNARGETGSGLWVLAMDGSSPPRKFLSLAESFQPISAQFSPDGHWVAYSATEAGRSEIYLASFPEPGEKIRVSTAGGLTPRWRRDGREIYFVSADNEMIATPITLGPSPQIGAPRPLFRMPPVGWQDFDVTADGSRFLIVETLPAPDSDAISLTVNWASVLDAKKHK